MISATKPTFFETQDAFRAWLEGHHETEKELLVGFRKVGSGRPSMTWSESVDQALCFGWIDGVRRRQDDKSYTIRFTPRQAKSIWSAINIAKVERLIESGLMKPAGLAAFSRREAARSAIYSYENRPRDLGAEFEAKFKRDPAAWAFFQAQPTGYQGLMIYRVVSAKQEGTRLRRLEQLITASREGKRL